MSKADDIFKDNLISIIYDGSKAPSNRAKWEDGKPANTVKKFGIVNEYDLRDEFPAITIRPVNLKKCMDEVLWIFQKKSNNINDLNSHIWDSWADSNGSIGKAYGYQVGNKFREINGVKLDQMDYVLYTLKHDPFDRHMVISFWNVDDLHYMNLMPCCWSINFCVTEEDGDKVLNITLNQRSNDFIVANGWNTCQYAILLMMVAQSSNMIPGRLVHVITDAHVYDRHIPIASQLLVRETHDAPKVSLNKSITNFYDFTVDDLIIEDYITEPQIKNIPVAI